jgi:hypothetical protein
MVQLTEEMKTFVRRPDVGKMLATLSPDGYPNIGPKGTIRAFDDSSLCYIEFVGKQHYQNLKANSRVAIACVDFAGRDGFRFVGEAGEVYDKLSAPFPPERKPKAIVVINVERVYALGGAQVGERIL